MEPFASLAEAVRASVPRLLINRDPVGPFAFRRRPGDVVQLGDVVSGVQELVEAIGWTRELDVLMAPVSIRVKKKAAEVLCAHELMCVFFVFSLFFLISRLQPRQKSEHLIQFGFILKV